MEVVKVEVVSHKVVGEIKEHGIQDLLAVELAWVGGGIGEVIVG